MQNLATWILGLAFCYQAQAEVGIFPLRPMDFGSVSVSENYPRSSTLEIENLSAKNRVHLEVSTNCESPFKVWAYSCSYILEPREKCELLVEYAPDSKGRDSCEIYIYDGRRLEHEVQVLGRARR